MNSKQGARYIKRRMGDDLKNQILVRNGILSEESALAQKKPSVLNCHRCSLVNTIDNKLCSRCSYPLTPQAYEEIKANEDMKFRIMEEKHAQDMKIMRDEMNQQFTQIMSMIQQNPNLANVKPQVLFERQLEGAPEADKFGQFNRKEIFTYV